MKEKIQKLEDEIKELYYNSTLSEHSFSKSKPQEWLPLFWDFHIKYVIDKSKTLAEKYQANLEAVWLGAILHDIARLYDEDPHDEKGSEIGYKTLIERGFDEELAQKAKEVIFTHSCSKYNPENLEQKIVATADAMAHFIPPFYLWYSKFVKDDFKKIIKTVLDKIEKDVNEKIFFEDEKKEIQKQCEVLKEWFKYKR